MYHDTGAFQFRKRWYVYSKNVFTQNYVCAKTALCTNAFLVFIEASYKKGA